MPGLTEWIIIGALGLLFFGKRLPDVGRSLGKGIVEFKKGLKGIEDDIDSASSTPTPPPPQYKPTDPNATPPNAG
jgi:sec-independent protein translocase protein TatA